MDLIDMQIMSVSRSSVTLEDFDKLLKLCKEREVPSILKQDLKVYFPEGHQPFDRVIFKNLQHVNEVEEDAIVSPIICLSNGSNFVAVKTAGDDFVQAQWSVITSILLLVKQAYNDIEVVDAKFDGENSYYLLKF